MKRITLRYYSLIPTPGIHETPYETEAGTARELLHELQAKRAIPLTTNIVKAARNDQFIEWDDPFADGDTLTILPPFSGG